VIGLAQLMIVLDVSIVNIALPDAQKALGFSNGDRQWIVTAYSLAFGSLLLLFGRICDLAGRRVMFLVGLVAFAGAAALGGAAPNFEILVTARGLLLGGVLTEPPAANATRLAISHYSKCPRWFVANCTSQPAELPDRRSANNRGQVPTIAARHRTRAEPR
jgi:MFS family permease